MSMETKSIALSFLFRKDGISPQKLLKYQKNKLNNVFHVDQEQTSPFDLSIKLNSTDIFNKEVKIQSNKETKEKMNE